MQNDQNTAEVKGCVLALDVGGSSVKSGLVGADGCWVELPALAVDAEGSASAILQTLDGVVRRGLSSAACPVVGIGVAIPGPFDYARGISRMTHKYAALMGVPLADVLRGACPGIGGLPIRFMHDANAFLAGERWRGAGTGTRRCLGVTLGTGIGVACWADGAFVTNESGSPSSEVSVWNRSYQGGRVEDAISTRGLVARYRRAQPGYEASQGVKGIADAARRGEADALRIFEELGMDLGAVLLPVCVRFEPERVVFGGRIATDFALFEAPLKTALACASHAPYAVRGQLGAAAALYGAADLFGIHRG